MLLTLPLLLPHLHCHDSAVTVDDWVEVIAAADCIALLLLCAAIISSELIMLCIIQCDDELKNM